ncbi:MAG TPA: hypothetical protein VHK88_00915 [Aquihabitans sp.]|nr:hypothetical protein [Aquihabitans sp.]
MTDVSDAIDPDEERLVETGDLADDPVTEPDDERLVEVAMESDVPVPDEERPADPVSPGETLDDPDETAEPNEPA